MPSDFRVFRGLQQLATWLALPIVVSSCQLYEMPKTGPSAQAVLDAAREVITARYPMSAASQGTPEEGFVAAVTPPALEGGAKTQRRISVIVRQNYTGAYEPVVRVRQYVDMATPLNGSPQAESPALAAPLDENRWRVMGYLEYEEQELTQAIFQKLGSSAGL
jgi:hypothetical protein